MLTKYKINHKSCCSNKTKLLTVQFIQDLKNCMNYNFRTNKLNNFIKNLENYVFQ